MSSKISNIVTIPNNPHPRFVVYRISWDEDSLKKSEPTANEFHLERANLDRDTDSPIWSVNLGSFCNLSQAQTKADSNCERVLKWHDCQ